MQQLLLNLPKSRDSQIHPYCYIELEYEKEAMLEKKQKPQTYKKTFPKTNPTELRGVIEGKDNGHQNPYANINSDTLEPLEITNYFTTLGKTSFENELKALLENYVPSLSKRVTLPPSYRDILKSSSRLTGTQRAKALNQLTRYHLPVYKKSNYGITKPLFNRENSLIKVVEDIIGNLLND